MAQHATIDADGKLTGFFDDTLHAAIPAGAVQLTPAQYATWLAKQHDFVWDHAIGGLTAAPPRPVLAPLRISGFQLKAQLASEPGSVTGKSLLDEVNAAVLAAGGLPAIAWAEATVFRRAGATITAIATHFGWDAAKLDALFIAAAAIED